MNRVVKFRGRNAKGEWLVGDLIHNRGETFIAPEGTANPLAEAGDFRVDPQTVGQFTGLVDKDGGKIYEGDVLVWHVNNQTSIAPVEYHDGAFWMTQDIGTGCEVCNDWLRGEYEILVNIHDHPELPYNE